MSECYCCQDMRRVEEMPTHIDDVCIWCQYASEKRKTEDLQTDLAKSQKRVEELEAFLSDTSAEFTISPPEDDAFYGDCSYTEDWEEAFEDWKQEQAKAEGGK